MSSFWSFSLFLLIGYVLLSAEASWINRFFRMPHRLHYKLNFNCKDRSVCATPFETEEYLRKFQWPDKILKYITCMDYVCLCPAFNGTVTDGKCYLPDGKILGKVFRKEYRQMTQDERDAYVNTMLKMQRDGTYRQISKIHQSAGVHSGPSFFPWHREYLKRVEFIFRLYNHTTAIPYWDSALDSYLPNPADSVYFSKYLLGEADKKGDVYNTVYKNFTTLDDRPTFNRQLGKEKDGEMINNPRIEFVLDQINISRVLAYSMPLVGCEPYPMDDRFLEYSHDYVHYFVNGDMEDRSTSSNDPIFFTHHSFIDFIWEMWRKRQQTPEQRENDYPEDIIDCMPPWHFKNASLVLLKPFRNVDGLSNKYVDNLADYVPRPMCATNTKECGSEFLWCDTLAVEAHCVSKVKLHGNCTGFEWSKDACYEGRCVEGKCRLESEITQTVKGPSEFNDSEAMERLRQKTMNFYRQKPKSSSLQMEVVNVKELSKPEKISRFM